jgi:DNA-binding NtrC family response regulator
MSAVETDPLAYRVLIIDNDEGISGFGPMTQLEFIDDSEYEIEIAPSWPDAVRMIARKIYDIFVIDINLGGPVNGLAAARMLRNGGFVQPIILATNKDKFLNKSVREMAPLLRQGPTHFFEKNEEGATTASVIRAAASRTDFFLRAMRIMHDAGIHQSAIQVDERIITPEELLGAASRLEDAQPDPVVEEARKALRDGFAIFMARMLRPANAR